MGTPKIAVLIVFLFALAACATGSSIVTGKVRPAVSPEIVKLYVDPPAEYETIGIVEASSDVEISSQAAQDRAVVELKSQAAKIGANGVLITNTGSKGSYFGSDGETKTATGRAIFVIKE